MFTKQALGLKEAQAALQAILEKASNDPDMPVAAAVVDDQCEIVCTVRMDRATPMFNYMALKKARSAAITGKDTRTWQEFLNRRNYKTNDFIPETTRVPGGIAIIKPDEDNVFGGIGVSGRSSNEDEELAVIGLKALLDASCG